MCRHNPHAGGSTLRLEWRAVTYPHAPALVRLGGDEVHAWCARLRPPASVERRLAQSLDDNERSRAARLVTARDRTRYVAAHGVLRHVLGAYLGTSANRVRYRYAARAS